ncbi:MULTISPECIES: AraC family transcriptional regulator [unclassified Bradyrhizobium]|uniref:AraC family transcriptional regulator n=1 Tax=unclassified Bradyrhizobium TaxID=2631580 RepID=UPI002FF2CD2D
MQLGTAPLLEQLPIFHSRNVEETGAFLRAKGYRFDIAARQARQLDARLNGVYMPGFYVGYVQYGGASVVLSPSPARTDTWIHLPLRGQLEATIGHDNIVCNPNLATIISPMRESCRLVSEADSSRIQLSLTKSSLTGQLAALLGEPPTAPLDFAPTIDLAAGYGRSLARYVLMAVADLEQAGSVLWSPTTMSQFEQFIITALLLSHPHNYSNALRRLERPVAPRDVKRAVDYIEAHLDQAVTVADLVTATGVAGRTLYMHFRDFKGVSPMRYLRNARLRQVRQALLRADPEANVTDIAMSTGFTHMGRFSVTYRTHFGESPSETLRGQTQQLRKQLKFGKL